MTRGVCQVWFEEKMASSEKNVDSADVFDNWEDLDETDILERKFKDILPTKDLAMDSKRCNKTPVNMILLGDDALRTQYVPPEPTVKILKRPSKESHMLNGDFKPRQQFKTLKQREQEYAEARLRILGEAHSSDKEERIFGIQNKVAPQQSRSETENIIRLPRGPDGTKGFNFRR